MRKGSLASLLAPLRRHIGALALAAAVALLLLFARGNEILRGASGIAFVLFIVGLVRPQTFEHVLRRRSAVLNVVVAGALLVLTLLPGIARVEQLTSVVEALAPSIGRDAAVYVAEEMFGAGTELVIVPDVGDTLRVRLDHNSYFAIVDDEPGAKFAHPVHYAIVATDGTIQLIDHEWLPTVNGLRWTVDDEREVAGHPVLGLTNADFPFPRVDVSATWPAPSVAAAAGRKIALVIDGGNRQRDWTEPFARKLDADTLAVADALSEQGYDIRRFGGYKGTVTPAARIADVTREIARIANEVAPGDEVVLFLNGHGTRAGEFVLIGRDGSRDLLKYSDLSASLAAIRSDVPVRVIIDACFSGTAVAPLSLRDNTIVTTATDATHTAPGGLDSRPTFSAVIAAAAKDAAADLDGDGTVTLDEAIAVSGKAFTALGSRVVATKGAPRVPTAQTVAGAAPVAAPAPVVAPVPAAPAAPVPPAAARVPASTPSPTLVPVALPPVAAPLRFVAGAPPRGTAGQRYVDYSFCAPKPATPTSACGPFPQTSNPSGGSPPYHFQLGSGVGFPPIGMSVSKDGILSGTPAAVGTYTFSVCAVDLSATQVCQTVTMTVGSPPTPEPTRQTCAVFGLAGSTWRGTFTLTLSGSDAGRYPSTGTFTYTFGPARPSGLICSFTVVSGQLTYAGVSYGLNNDAFGEGYVSCTLIDQPSCDILRVRYAWKGYRGFYQYEGLVWDDYYKGRGSLTLTTMSGPLANQTGTFTATKQ
jgi:hypothetical protein